MRVKDDKIIYELNVALPTQSFESKVDTTAQCKDLYEQVQLIFWYKISKHLMDYMYLWNFINCQ